MDAYNKLGIGGVNLTKSGYYPDDTTVLDAQNAERVLDIEKGGEATLSKRGGYVSLGAELGAAIIGMAEVRFISALPLDVAFSSLPISIITGPVDTGASVSALVGAQPTYWQATADAVNTTYWRSDAGGGNGTSTIRFGMDPVADPGVNTVHILRLTIRVNSLSESPGLTTRLYAGTTLIREDVYASGTIAGGAGFTDFDASLSEAEVIAFRAAGGYATPRVEIVIANDNVFPSDFLDVSRIEFLHSV